MPVGRKPKPAKLRVLQGNAGHRFIRPEVVPPTGVPTCPQHLSPSARAEWDRLAVEMASTGVLTTWDRGVMAAYCSSYAHWAEAEVQVNALGSVVKAAKSGVPMQNPYLSIANGAQDRMLRLAAELGLSPVSRARVGAVEAKKEGSKLEKYRGRA